MTKQEKIDNYLDGVMSPEEEKEFMAECCLSPSLGYMLYATGIRRALQ